jgi:hypothetical protein
MYQVVHLLKSREQQIYAEEPQYRQ